MTIELEEFLARSGIDARTMEQWFALEWIVPPQAAPRAISDVDAARAFFIRDLKADFGVNDAGIEIVLHLLDQMHGLRRALLALGEELTSRQGQGERSLE
ncbi:MAG: chaperone modulator CbpM [Nitrobacter sp.]